MVFITHIHRPNNFVHILKMYLTKWGGSINILLNLRHICEMFGNLVKFFLKSEFKFQLCLLLVA